MLNGLPILIVEDDRMIALSLATIIEDMRGLPIGPVGTVEEALQRLETEPVKAAILDANLDQDITPVALALADRAIPFVIHSGNGEPDVLSGKYPHLPTVMRPSAITAVLTTLLDCFSSEDMRFDH
jgi:DNA-binding NtrC family response regulator